MKFTFRPLRGLWLLLLTILAYYDFGWGAAFYVVLAFVDVEMN